MIEARGLTKRFGDKLAVDRLSFTVEPGRVTGFLGPNGAGKSTTMRLILGLDRPTAGRVTVDGKPFRQLAHPMREVGAVPTPRAPALQDTASPPSLPWRPRCAGGLPHHAPALGRHGRRESAPAPPPRPR